MAVAMDIKKEVDEEDAYLLDADSQYSLNEAINIKIENDLADSSDVFKKNVSKRVNTWPRRVKSCFVRGCLSNSEGFPTKVLITIPRNENRRRAWFEAARQPYITNNSTRYCCEDHFNVPDDFENYMRFRFMGGPIFVKKHVVPHKFKWWSVPSLESSCEPKSVVKKRKTRTDNLPLTSGSRQTTVEIQVICDTCGAENCNHMAGEETNYLLTLETQESETDTEIDEQSQSEPSSNDSTFEELLIAEVKARPVIWNSRLKRSQRGKTENIKLWLQIAKFFANQYSIQYLQKEWRNLKAQFIKARGEEEIYVLSGSEVRPNWKHYESMKFLNDCMVAPRAITSIIGLQDMPASTSTSPEPQIPKRTKRLRQRLDEREESTSVIVETISLPPPPISIPSPTINPICQRLSEMLGTLNGEDRLDLEIELLQLAKKFINENKKN